MPYQAILNVNTCACKPIGPGHPPDRSPTLRSRRRNVINCARMTAPFQRAFFFLLDGARVDLFGEYLQRGDLPNIARYLVEPGRFTRATTVFPSVTGVAYVPYLTGMFPGRANMPGYRWFDRERYHRQPISFMRFRNYSGLGS